MRNGVFLVVGLLAWTTACGSDDGGGRPGTSGGAGGTSGGSGGTSAGGTGGTASGGTSTGGTGGTASANAPADNSAASIASYIMAQSFTGTGWTAETTEPREPSSVVSPHGNVRVYLNDEAVNAQSGAASASDVEYPLNAMSVKELYDGTTVVGYAVMLKSAEGTGTNTWTYWCYGPAGRCSSSSAETTADAPIYGTPESNCGACHGGTIFTMIQ